MAIKLGMEAALKYKTGGQAGAGAWTARISSSSRARSDRSRRGQAPVGGLGSRGRPRTFSPTMLRCTSEVPSPISRIFESR